MRLHLASEAEVERAAHELAASAAKAVPGAPIDGYLVQEMVDGVEMIVGARTDPLYGPMLVVGAGGILVELVKDVAFRLLPVTPEDARAMIAELKVAKLLAGFRGKPAADVDALVEAICGLSDFYLDHRHLLSDHRDQSADRAGQGKACARSTCGRCVPAAVTLTAELDHAHDGEDAVAICCERSLPAHCAVVLPAARAGAGRRGLLQGPADQHVYRAARSAAATTPMRGWSDATSAATSRAIRRSSPMNMPGASGNSGDPAFVHLAEGSDRICRRSCPAAITKPLYDVQERIKYDFTQARLSRQRQHRGQPVLGAHRRQGEDRSTISSPTS